MATPHDSTPLLITCRSHKHILYTNDVRGKSKHLDSAFFGSFLEAHTKTISLDEHDPAKIVALVSFLREDSYNVPDNAQPLYFHGSMFTEADYFSFPKLQSYACAEFRKCMNKRWPHMTGRERLDIVEFVFDSETPVVSRELRDAVALDLYRYVADPSTMPAMLSMIDAYGANKLVANVIVHMSEHARVLDEKGGNGSGQLAKVLRENLSEKVFPAIDRLQEFDTSRLRSHDSTALRSLGSSKSTFEERMKGVRDVVKLPQQQNELDVLNSFVHICNTRFWNGVMVKSWYSISS